MKKNLHSFSNCEYRLFSVLIFCFGWVCGCSGSVPDTIGQYAPCPDSPNCVYSKSPLNLHKIAPVTYSGSREDAKNRLISILKSMPKHRIRIDREQFLHVEFTSRYLGFVDDAEFYLDEPGLIHFRSASRLGHSDFRVNRERMEAIRKKFKTLSGIK